MINIFGTDIKITRGDSAYITFDITDASGDDVTLSEDDIVRCQVRDKCDGTLIFEGTIDRNDEEGTAIWHIKPDDTNGIALGTYYWDAQVEYPNGDVFSFVPVSKFVVLSEITLPQ